MIADEGLTGMGSPHPNSLNTGLPRFGISKSGQVETEGEGGKILTSHQEAVNGD